MNIALMAHDNRKELMVQFCTAYCGILAKHTLCATARTGQQIADATGRTQTSRIFPACATRTTCPLPATWPPLRCWCWVWTGATWTGVTSSTPRTSPLRLDNHRQIAYNKG